MRGNMPPRTLALILLAACGRELADVPPDAPAQLAPPVACGTQLPGLSLETVESSGTYETELAALDLQTVADPYDFGAEIALVRGLVNYMLGRESGTSFTRAEAEAAGALGRAVQGAIAITGGAKVDLTFLRRGLYYAYPCSTSIPKDLAALVERYGDYTAWPSVSVDCAPPKALPRRVYSNAAFGVYVADTLEGTGVRETEVLFTALRENESLDFAVYTPTGQLTDRSTFATTDGSSIVAAAPFTCMTCHVDKASWTFSVQRPAGTGAGCK